MYAPFVSDWRTIGAVRSAASAASCEARRNPSAGLAAMSDSTPVAVFAAFFPVVVCVVAVSAPLLLGVDVSNCRGRKLSPHGGRSGDLSFWFRKRQARRDERCHADEERRHP